MIITIGHTGDYEEIELHPSDCIMYEHFQIYPQPDGSLVIRADLMSSKVGVMNIQPEASNAFRAVLRK